MQIVVYLPLVYAMTFLIAAFFEKRHIWKQRFIVLAFTGAALALIWQG